MHENETPLKRLMSLLARNADVPLRIVLAATFIVHGKDKLFKAGGMEGFTGYMVSLGLPLPGLQAWMAALSEFGGGILLLLGLFTRFAAASQIVVMLVAISMVHYSQGFKMHGAGQGTGGWEWQFALMCMALALVMRGAGPLSLDSIFFSHWHEKKH